MPAPAHPHSATLTLANGLHVILHAASHLQRCAAVVRVAAGSHDAPLAWPGLAHFLEHLLFLGTERFPTGEGLMTYVQQHGGQVNASTRERITEFFFELPVPNVAQGLERLADMLARPRLALDDQLREREVLQAEFVAWSRDAKAQQQVALLEGVANGHPLRDFHAGNRDSLPVETEAFQQALRAFHAQFYQSGQMTLSLAGPQPLDELQALAHRFGEIIPTGSGHPQAAPPALMDGQPQAYRHVAGQQLHHVIACNAPRETLEFLCTWLNNPAPGGLLAELQAQGMATALHASVLYHFAGQALLDIDFTLNQPGESVTPVEALLHDWLSFFAHSDWTPLREEFARVTVRQRQVQGALALARNDSEALSDHSIAALHTLLDSLQLPAAKHTWQRPPDNPFLRPSDTEPRAGLIRGQTSAHRGLRTFAQDRSRGRREASALTFISQAVPTDRQEGALYLNWRFDSPAPSGLEGALHVLSENARQAGLALTFETTGHDWRISMVGLHALMPKVLEALAQSLTQAHPTPDTTPPPLAIRALLKALPAYCVETTAERAHQPASWHTARWHGLGIGLPATCEALIKTAAAGLPGQPAGIERQPRDLNGQCVWHAVKTDAGEAALLLFCPTPSLSLADEAAWRLLVHRVQGPFYQRLRVEQQIGYAVFSGIRQINGQTGMLFGVQSPHLSLDEIVQHLHRFLAQVPTLIERDTDLGNTALAQQFNVDTLPTSQAAELLWHAHLAGHPSDYLERLQQHLYACTYANLQHAAQHLKDAVGGWLWVANGAPSTDLWKVKG
ncbi:pyrroloquinoline quinone biosynthesis protein PqqF [Pseudomonas lurida]|uniref:pyrroloquinoline quinone biosynthesis protein PqqF n=1 Tax=Pseudomonas lurida TaxID=244566 RepID=UPI0015E2BB85|nr:pyrroloquinoline quinone biosynthesis protein PqqF [Pseudomonas lurida]MBA1294973.1 pyrroloquinoline quinone biosynthesis protein PqqF [Pseudomonas lurida]